MGAEILAALKAIAALPDLIKAGNNAILKLGDSITEKNIAGLKSDVNLIVSKLKSAKSKDERAALIEELNKKVSK